MKPLNQPALRFAGFADAWEQRKLGDVVDIVGGGTPETTNSAYWNGDIDWYSPTEIGTKVYANGSVKKITALGLEKSSAKILPANSTILFTSRAGIGDMAILKKQGATNQGFQSFVVGNGVNVYFLYSMGRQIKDFAIKNASGSTFLEISKNQLAKMNVIIPNEKEQTAIGNFFKQLDAAIASHQRKPVLQKASKIKQADTISACFWLAKSGQMPHHNIGILIFKFLNNMNISVLRGGHARMPEPSRHAGNRYPGKKQ